MKNMVRTMVLFLGDMAMMVIAFFIMLEIAFPQQEIQKAVNSHFLPFIFVSLIWLLVFFLFNLYETQSIKPTISHLRRISIASVVALIVSIIMFYIVPFFGITPKTNLLIFSITFIFLFIVWRRIFYNVFAVYFRKYVAFVVDLNKDENCTKELVNYIKIYPQSGFLVFGIYSSLGEFLKEKKGGQVNTLVISKNILKGNEDLKLIYNSVENILDLTYAYEDILGKIPIDSIDEVWFLHNVHSTNTTFYNIITYFIDIIIVLIILLITLPILFIVALFIKLNDKGPIFYTQSRVGKGDKIFKLYKFRSMVMDSELNGAVWTDKNDNRITPIGKIIRKLHIDEIPQMINILKGDLSLVGPRPERPEFVSQLEKSIPHYKLRHIIRPGFTGWAQIKYKYANTIESSKEKFEYDLYYIKNRDAFMNLGIVLRTIQIIFTH